MQRLQEDGTLEGKTVKEVMDTWTVQMGYPVISIDRFEPTLFCHIFLRPLSSAHVDNWAIQSSTMTGDTCQVSFPLECSPPSTNFVLKLKLKCRRYDGSKSATAKQER